MKFNIHTYPIIRISIRNIEANTVEEAVKIAVEKMHKEVLPSVVGHGKDVESADELAYVMADQLLENGKTDYDNASIIIEGNELLKLI